LRIADFRKRAIQLRIVRSAKKQQVGHGGTEDAEEILVSFSFSPRPLRLRSNLSTVANRDL
jgi:hypothetical protein